VGRSVEVDASLDPVAIPGRVLNELFAHCLETLPEECCGLVVGDARERYGRVVRCRNDMTQRHQRDPARHPRSGREAFWMNELDYERAQDEATRDGCEVTAVYHSHVGAKAYLSELDLAYAEHPDFPFRRADHIVLPVFERVVGAPAIFQRGAGGFVGKSLVAAAP
jgi:proteasome lid subunit RPN8/RPN11